MKIWTYKEARDKIKLELDLTEEDFVVENEFIGYFNSAIDEAEAEIHALNEEYFLTKSTITLIAGVQDYVLPDNIYAMKIRGLMYRNGSTIYPVPRVRGERKFHDIMMSEQYDTAGEYRYFIRNDSVECGYNIALVPPSRESGEFLTLWYLRNANRIPLVGEAKEGGGTYSLAEVEATKIECPEFINFIMTVVRSYCSGKENGGQITQEDAALVQQQRKMMVDTLTKMVVDDDDTVAQDFSHYLDHS